MQTVTSEQVASEPQSTTGELPDWRYPHQLAIGLDMHRKRRRGLGGVLKDSHRADLRTVRSRELDKAPSDRGWSPMPRFRPQPCLTGSVPRKHSHHGRTPTMVANKPTAALTSHHPKGLGNRQLRR